MRFTTKIPSVTSPNPDSQTVTPPLQIPKKWWLISSLLAVVSAAFNFVRIQDLNPVILQDEWVYSMTSRRIGFWEQNPALDFGNYFFNVVYSWTNVCDANFYLCAKATNHLFLVGFALALFYSIAVISKPSVGLAVIPFATLGPVSIYGSLFLPESLFFFLIGLTVALMVRFFAGFRVRDLALAGLAMAFASLTKPHGLISLALVSLVVLLVVAHQKTLLAGLRSAFFFAGTSIIGKVVFGFVLAGPKGLNPLAGYRVGRSGFLTGSDAQNTSIGLIERLEGMATELPNQLVIQSTSVLLLFGLALAVTMLGTFGFGLNSSGLERRFALLMFVWTLGLIVTFSIFGAYLTAGGADHSTRALMRYYDFILPMVVGASLVVAMKWFSGGRLPSFPARLAASVFAFAVGTWGVQNLITSLEIQIADAPHLAGFVSSNLAGMVTSASALILTGILMFQPRYLAMALIPLSVLTFVALGDATSKVYSASRLEDSAADLTGKTSDLKLTDAALIISHSRFDARVVSFWQDSLADFTILPKGSVVDLTLVLAEYPEVWLSGQFVPDANAPAPVESGLGYLIFRPDSGGSIKDYVDPQLEGVETIQGFSRITTEGHMLSGQMGTLVLSDAVSDGTIELHFESDRGLSGSEVQVSCGATEARLILPELRGVTSVSLALEGPCQDVIVRFSGFSSDQTPSLDVGSRLRLTRLEYSQ